MDILAAAETIKRNFAQELHDAAAGKKTSLRFIKHLLPSEKPVKDGDLLQVLVLGGSVFRKALLKKENNQLTIIESFTEDHPLFVSEDALLLYIIDNLYDNSNMIAINFAFPMTPVLRNNLMDGRLLKGSKGNTFNGLAGMMVGETIEQYIWNTQKRHISVAVANDVICLLLSGLDLYPNDNLTGAIMGTGTNIACLHDGFAVNVQTSSFNKFTPSVECIDIDKTSIRPGFSLFEKETAGGYLYQHFNLYLDKHQINYPSLTSTKELGELATRSPEELTPALSYQEREKLRSTATLLLEKSAAYFAGQITGLAAFKASPITVIMEGSMYWENPLYQQFVKHYLLRLSADYSITLVRVENSSIIGGAKLVV